MVIESLASRTSGRFPLAVHSALIAMVVPASTQSPSAPLTVVAHMALSSVSIAIIVGTASVGAAARQIRNGAFPKHRLGAHVPEDSPLWSSNRHPESHVGSGWLQAPSGSHLPLAPQLGLLAAPGSQRSQTACPTQIRPVGHASSCSWSQAGWS
jgi:hypothetical protein